MPEPTVPLPGAETYYPNGIDGLTGRPLVDPLPAAEVADLARAQDPDTPWLSQLQARAQTSLWSPPGSDNLAEAGWGYICHKDEAPEVRDALETLAEHRRKQIAKTQPERASWVKSFEYDGQQSVADWLADKKVGIGDYKPAKVPFYLLVVGSPEQIPFEWSLALDLDYAVGRIHFEDPADYSRYVRSVISYEKGKAPPRAREAVFFGTCHDADYNTQMSALHLVDPLADGVPEDETPGVATGLGYATRKLRDAAATRAALEAVLAPAGDTDPPAFLFTATHGIGFTPDHWDEQRARQGALLCQDWDGSDPFKPEHTFAAADLPASARVHGLIAFVNACFSAATPALDPFWSRKGSPPRAVAQHPFLAALPQALLSHAGGGALACIGHSERSWSSSVYSEKVGSLSQPYRYAVHWILEGMPVGYAVSPFLDRYARLGHDLNNMLKAAHWGLPVDEYVLARLWTRYHDAGGYVVVGDPAVRLRVKSRRRRTG